MDLKNLKSNQEVLLSHMKKQGYSHSYIANINREIIFLLNNGKNDKSYLEFYKRTTKSNKNTDKRERRLDTLNIIMNFDIYGKLPDRTRVKHHIIDNSKYSKLHDEFRNVIDTYVKVSNKTEKKKSTIYCETLNCITFLYYFQSKNITRIKDITENDVLSFFLNDKKELNYSCSYKKNIRAVFKGCVPYIEGIENLMNYLPRLREIRKNIQYLNKDEVELIKEVLNNNSNISLRNKAIVTLLLYTGLRGCDIANLKLNNIDWEKEIIYITQVKTDVPLELPLLTPVGNAIYNYIYHERPNVNISNVFIREDANIAITKSSVDLAVSKVMDEANIRMKKGERRGTHIFRHYIATALLENNISQPIISRNFRTYIS